MKLPQVNSISLPKITKANLKKYIVEQLSQEPEVEKVIIFGSFLGLLFNKIDIIRKQDRTRNNHTIVCPNCICASCSLFNKQSHLSSNNVNGTKEQHSLNNFFWANLNSPQWGLSILL